MSLGPIRSGTPLGLFGLAAATFVLAGLQLGWVDPAQGKDVALVLAGFAAPAQLLAAILGYASGDGLAGTALGVLALTWLAFGLILHAAEPGATSDALGLFLCMSGAALLISGVATAIGRRVLAVVFLTASIRLFLTAVYELTGGSGWKRAAGIVGVALAALALVVAAIATVCPDRFGGFNAGERGSPQT
jgi:succinate-acetate transporter protein